MLCHRKKFLVTGKKFLSHKKFLAKVGNFLSQELGGNLMSQQVVFHVDKHLFPEEISCTG